MHKECKRVLCHNRNIILNYCKQHNLLANLVPIKLYFYCSDNQSHSRRLSTYTIHRYPRENNKIAIFTNFHHNLFFPFFFRHSKTSLLPSKKLPPPSPAKNAYSTCRSFSKCLVSMVICHMTSSIECEVQQQCDNKRDKNML